MRMLSDDDEDTSASGPVKGQTSQQPAWMRNLFDRCKEWLALLPMVREPSFRPIAHRMTANPLAYSNSTA